MAIDNNFDGVPDILESIDSRLALLVNASRTKSQAHYADDVTANFQRLLKRLDERSKDIQQPPPPVRDPNKLKESEQKKPEQEGWWGRLLNKLSGRDEQQKKADEGVKHWEKKFRDAKANAEEAPKEFERAKKDYIKALDELTAANKKGVNSTRFEENLQRARVRLSAAEDRLTETPRTLQEAEGEYRHQKHLAGPGAGIGRKRTAMANVAGFFGFDDVKNRLNNSVHMSQLGARTAAGDPIAAAQLAAAKKAQKGQGLGMIRDAAGKFMDSERGGDMMSAAGQGIMGAGMMMSGPAAPAVMVVGAFTKVIGESIEKLRKWNDQLLDANLRFAEFSGAMAGVQAEQMTRQIERDRQRGDRRSGVAQMHMRSREGLEDSMAVFEDVGASIKGLFLTGLNKVTNFFLSPMAKALERIATDVGLLRQAEDQPMGLNQWADQMAEQNMSEALSGRPMRFGGGTGLRS